MGVSSASESLEQSLWRESDRGRKEKKIKDRESLCYEMKGGELEGGLGKGTEGDK
jgi:hypothetical protein